MQPKLTRRLFSARGWRLSSNDLSLRSLHSFLRSRRKSIRQRPKNIDLIFRTKRGQFLDIWLGRHRQYSLCCWCGHLLHHPYESSSGRRQDQHGRWNRTADPDSMWNPARQEDIPSGTKDSFLTIADKCVLTIEHIECLVLDMVEMVRRGMSGRRYLVHHRKSAACRFCCGLDDTKVIEEPKCWSFRFRYTLSHKLIRQHSILKVWS